MTRVKLHITDKAISNLIIQTLGDSVELVDAPEPVQPAFGIDTSALLLHAAPKMQTSEPYYRKFEKKKYRNK